MGNKQENRSSNNFLLYLPDHLMPASTLEGGSTQRAIETWWSTPRLSRKVRQAVAPLSSPPPDPATLSTTLAQFPSLAVALGSWSSPPLPHFQLGGPGQVSQPLCGWECSCKVRLLLPSEGCCEGSPWRTLDPRALTPFLLPP